MAEYIPEAPVNDAARKRNGSLPGMGGVYNTINAHLYHYAGNNPVKYTDPDGRFAITWPLIKAALEWVIPAICAVFTTKILNDSKNSHKTDSQGSIIGAKNILDSFPIVDTEGPQISEAKKHHEDKTQGKIENEIKAELGRKLTKDESDRWHDEMEKAKKEKIKNGEVPKGEKNPSLTEEELREAARYTLGVEL
jgi:hypothetical protein